MYRHQKSIKVRAYSGVRIVTLTFTRPNCHPNQEKIVTQIHQLYPQKVQCIVVKLQKTDLFGLPKNFSDFSIFFTFELLNYSFDHFWNKFDHWKYSLVLWNSNFASGSSYNVISYRLLSCRVFWEIVIINQGWPQPAEQ